VDAKGSIVKGSEMAMESLSVWRSALRDREVIMVSVIVTLVALLLMVSCQCSYMLGLFDAMRAAREIVPKSDQSQNE